MFFRKAKRQPGRPPSWTYRSIAAKHHKMRCCVRGCREDRPWKLDVHHKDGNPWNNRPGNLEWRCEPHHMAVHGRTWVSPRPQMVTMTTGPHLGRGCCLGTLVSAGMWIVLIVALIAVVHML